MTNVLIVRLKSLKLSVSMTVKTVKIKLVVLGTKYFGRKLMRKNVENYVKNVKKYSILVTMKLSVRMKMENA